MVRGNVEVMDGKEGGGWTDGWRADESEGWRKDGRWVLVKNLKHYNLDPTGILFVVLDIAIKVCHGALMALSWEPRS